MPLDIKTLCQYRIERAKTESEKSVIIQISLSHLKKILRHSWNMPGNF